ncbi:hypothetical protein NIE79_001407 [Micromonospora sp. NIE79]|uniref:Uncharacterized protein n=1 Tax=Micromonospora trifolii TaxID=2911208 RepID=A0ABS9N2R1_9ACTN|nr:sigma factor [Micromonospora trifolii]MCG5443594.1 hypothetical protein [Micromonospora trifolii]
MPVDVEGYRDYVGARLEPLRRTAYLLSGDWHTADDLVSATLVKLLRHWSRVSVPIQLSRGGDRGDLVIGLSPALGAVAGCTLAMDSTKDCSTAQLPDGTQMALGTEVDAAAGTSRRSATVLRPDGTAVGVSLVQPGASLDEMLLTEDQLVTFGRWPGFNLYP